MTDPILLRSYSPFKATKMWNKLLSSFKEGMELKRKRYRLKSYDQCFSGAEALDWLHMYLQNSPSFGDHVTREQAFMLLQKFIENNVFQNAVGKTCKKFQDTNCLYKFIEEDTEGKNYKQKNKENIPSQNSLSNIIQHFSRRNSRNIEEYQQTPLGKVVESNILPVRKDEEHKECKTVASGMTPLALDLNKISMATIDDAKQYQYADMSTILFGPAEEDQTELLDTSISRSQFMRSNSLRVNKKGNSNTNFVPSFLRSKAASVEDFIANKDKSENSTQSKANKKRAIVRKFGKNSQNSSESRRHTVTLGKRPSQEIESEQSPSKKWKKDRVVKSDSNLENKGYMTNLLPRKAVVVLGERPSHINHVESYNTYNVVNLPGYKPSKTSKSHMSKKGQDHKLSHFNPLIDSKNENMKPKRKKEKKKHPILKPSIVPLCSSNCNALSPKLTKLIAKPLSPHPMRRRSLSQNNIALQKHFQSTNDIYKSSMEINKLKRSRQSNWKLNKGSLYKASSMWSINTIGASEIEQEVPKVTTADIEDTWKSVVILSLKKLLGAKRISDFLNESEVCGNSIMKNVNWKIPELTQDAPEWLLSAMNCLIDWPKSNLDTDDSILQDLPNYPGFERDVYCAVKEHYQTTLNEPLISSHLYPLLQECSDILYDNVDGAIRLLQHVTLLVPCWNRRQLQLLVNFMKRISDNEVLEISKDLPNRDLVIHSFYRLITRQEKQAISIGFQDAVAIRICGFLMDHYHEVFKAPSGLRVQVDHKLAVTLGAPSFTKQIELEEEDVRYTRPSSADANPRSLSKQRSYCKQITKQEYEKEAKELSKKAIRELLLSILDDKKLTEKERNRRLKQIEKAYPDIYAESASNGDDVSNCSTISQRSTNFTHGLKPSFLREKIL